MNNLHSSELYFERPISARRPDMWLQNTKSSSIVFIYLLTDSKKIGPAVQRHKHNYTLITLKHTQSYKQDRIQSFVLALSVYSPS